MESVVSTIRHQISENHATDLSKVVYVIWEWQQKGNSNFTVTTRVDQYVKMWDLFANEVTHAILKTFFQYALMQCRYISL